MDAWQAFSQNNRKVKLHLIGRDTGILSNYTHDETIIYHGVMNKDDLMKGYSKYDVAIFPSFVECFSLAPLEAMNAGVPVINTSLCSGKELIKNGVDGLLIDPNNKDSIVFSLNKIISMNSSERKYLATNASKLVASKFNFMNLVRINISMYESL